MKKSIVKKYTQQEMFDLLDSTSRLFNFKVTRAASPHGWFESKNKDRMIVLRSGTVEIRTKDKLIPYEKKLIAKLLNAKFTSESKDEKKPEIRIYEFDFTGNGYY
jgi:hypothetical protein